MASKTTIANITLSKIGQPRVANIETENIKAARVVNNAWDIIRDAVLRAYPWNFALKRVSLAPDAEAPSWQYTYAYTMPADFLALDLIQYNPDYSFEDNKIITNEGPTLYIRYIARIENTESWSADFNEAFATKLASVASEEITQSNTKKDALANAYENLIRVAYRTDAKENPIATLEEDAWVIARA